MPSSESRRREFARVGGKRLAAAEDEAITNLKFSLGVAVLALSDMLGLVHFGLLADFAFGWALLADFLFAPALLLLLRPLAIPRRRVPAPGSAPRSLE